MATLHLTDRAIKSLAVEQGVSEFRDTSFRGFGIRVTDKGTKSFFVIYPVGGKRRRRGLGRYPLVSLAEARAKARETLVAVSQGEDPQEARESEQSGLTFAEMADSFLEGYADANHSAAWRREEERLLRKKILPTLGEKRASEITRRDVIDLLDVVAERGVALANRVRAVLSSIYNWALSRDLVEHNPVVGVKKAGKERPRERVLSEAEIRHVWAACEDEPSLVAVSVQLVLVTAQRGGEVRAMRWADIANSWWTIPTTKSGRSHRVFLSPLAHRLLATLDPETEYVFPGGRGKPHLTSPYKAMQRIAAAAAIPHWTIHDLRRTAATMMGSMKVSPFIVERVLGHTDNRITAIYDRSSYDDDKREALERWGARLEELLAG